MLQHMDRLDEDARVNSRNTSTNMTGREMQEQVQKFGRVLPGNLLSGTVEHSKGIEVTHVYKEFSGKILTE